MKPPTYVEQEYARCCAKCKFAGWQCNLDYLMCYHGDSADAVNDSLLLEGDEKSQWWVERHVDPEGVCEQFQPGKPQDVRWSEPFVEPAACEAQL